jgi:hypothetical protein
MSSLEDGVGNTEKSSENRGTTRVKEEGAGVRRMASAFYTHPVLELYNYCAMKREQGEGSG